LKPWEAETIPALLAASAEQFGARTAIEDGDVVLRYSELAEAAEQAARAFGAAGVEHGDRVAIWAPNLWEWIVAALGVHSVGGVLVPLNTRFKAAEACYVLRRSKARVLCTVGEFLGTNYADALEGQQLPDLERIVTFRGSSRAGTAWAEFLAGAAGFSPEQAQARAEAVSGDDLSDIMFTSGTTGNPKGVMTCHGQNLRGFAVWSDVVGLREDDRYLIVNAFFHAFGYKAGWLSCLMRGATILPHQVFDVPQVLERIGKERVSVLPGPPNLYQSILAHPDRESYDLSCLRLAVTGAAPTPVELIRRMGSELGFETIITGYGLTECCGIVSMCRYDDDPETIATTSGRAIPGVEVRCVDSEGNEVERGEPGEVWVRGYNVMRGYYDDPAETQKAVDPDGWLHTGDIAVMDDRGYLRITDRIKDMFIMGGFNCYPAEIENLMFAHGEIAQVAVIGIPDQRSGEVGMAFVVPRPEAKLDADGLIAWCRKQMANYKVPRRVLIVDALPVNAAGKVMKSVLREQAAASRSAEGSGSGTTA